MVGLVSHVCLFFYVSQCRILAILTRIININKSFSLVMSDIMTGVVVHERQSDKEDDLNNKSSQMQNDHSDMPEGASGQPAEIPLALPSLTSPSSTEVIVNPTSYVNARQTPPNGTRTSIQTGPKKTDLIGHAAVHFLARRKELMFAITSLLALAVGVFALWPAISSASDSREARKLAQWEAEKDFIETCQSVRPDNFSHRIEYFICLCCCSTTGKCANRSEMLN